MSVVRLRGSELSEGEVCTSSNDEDHKLFSSAGANCIVGRYGRVVDCVWAQVAHVDLRCIHVSNLKTID